MAKYDQEIATFNDTLKALDTIINNWDEHWSFGGNGGEIHNTMIEVSLNMRQNAKKMKQELIANIQKWENQ
jgi:hypothetical protein